MKGHFTQLPKDFPTDKHRLGQIIRAARKLRNLTQIDVSRALGISQGYLSRLERGLLIPDTFTWFAFSRVVNIQPDLLLYGAIDELRSISSSLSAAPTGFRLPPHYSHDIGSTVRAAVPLLHFAETALGQNTLAKYLSQQKTDPDFFVVMDNPINLNFTLDLASYLISKGHLSDTLLPQLLAPITRPEGQGLLYNGFACTTNSQERLRHWIKQAPYFETDFEYLILDSKENAMELAVKPAAHLAAFDYRNNKVLGDFLCRYRKAYFSKLLRESDAAPLQFTESECHFHGASRCVYRLHS